MKTNDVDSCMSNIVKLEWLEFNTWTEVLNDVEGRYGFPCVYVLADKNRVPLYIGSATQREKKKNGIEYSGGLRMRYYHDWTVLDACMEGTGRKVFIAEVEARQARKIEAQLIYENKPRYNEKMKDTLPQVMLKLLHKGSHPLLKH